MLIKLIKTRSVLTGSGTWPRFLRYLTEVESTRPGLPMFGNWPKDTGSDSTGSHHWPAGVITVTLVSRVSKENLSVRIYRTFDRMSDDLAALIFI